MEISLQPEEVELLRRILPDVLSDLRMEIADTEDFDMRESMKRDEEILNGLIDKLGKQQKKRAA